MIRRPPRSTLSSSSAASDVYKRQVQGVPGVLAVDDPPGDRRDPGQRVPVAQQLEGAELDDLLAEELGRGVAGVLDGLVSRTAEAHKVVVLRHDLSGRTGDCLLY